MCERIDEKRETHSRLVKQFDRYANCTRHGRGRERRWVGMFGLKLRALRRVRVWGLKLLDANIKKTCIAAGLVGANNTMKV